MSNNRVVKNCRFNFNHYQYILEKAKKYDYQILSCYDFFKKQDTLPNRYIILRHDVDHYPDRAVEFAKIEARLKVKSSFFIRVHSDQYNIFNFGTYNSLKSIIKMGHEIGLHAEPIDFCMTSKEDSKSIFRKELHVLRFILDCDIHGVCPHVDWTEYNNLDFFQKLDLSEYGLKYHTYEHEFFDKNFYVSDGQHYYWKNYKNGTLLEQHLCPCKIIEQEVPGIYILTHAMNWFDTEYHLMKP